MLVEGHGLSGPDKLSVEPGGEETCVITYSPTLVGETTGRFVDRLWADCQFICHIHIHRVVFIGSPDGEFWYHMTLVGQDPDPVMMEIMECPLGW